MSGLERLSFINWSSILYGGDFVLMTLRELRNISKFIASFVKKNMLLFGLSMIRSYVHPWEQFIWPSYLSSEELLLTNIAHFSHIGLSISSLSVSLRDEIFCHALYMSFVLGHKICGNQPNSTSCIYDKVMVYWISLVTIALTGAIPFKSWISRIWQRSFNNAYSPCLHI